VFERFTEQARQVIVLAQEEARRVKHNYIGTEHILLGLLREEQGLAAAVLTSHGLSLESARAQVVRIIGSGEDVAAGQIPFTPRAKRILERALREALGLGHNYIGTEHLALALLRERDGVGVHVLHDLGIDPDVVIDDLTEKLLAGESRETGPAEGTPYEPRRALSSLLEFATTAREYERILQGGDLTTNAYVAGAVSALRDAGVISPDEAQRWLLELRGRPEPGTATAFTGATLVRLVPAPEQPNGDFRVLGVELYADGCVVRVRVPPGGVLPTDLTLEDDAGTSYSEAEPPDWHGSDGVVGDFPFVPAVPQAGAELTVTVRFKDGDKRSARISL
jgi:hypothetical protein